MTLNTNQKGSHSETTTITEVSFKDSTGVSPKQTEKDNG